MSVNEVAEGSTVLNRFRLALYRQGNRFRAVSLVCTHEPCLIVQQTGGFLCPCHGSQFNKDGAPVNGPATEPLHWYRLSMGPDNALTAHLDDKVGPDWALELDL